MQANECPRCGAPITSSATQCQYCKTVLTTNAEAPVEGADPQGLETGWRWCTKCGGLFFDAETGSGPCGGGGTHTADADSCYVLSLDDEEADGEDGWEWCQRCNCLFYGDEGLCAAGGRHDGSESGEYRILEEAEDDDEDEVEDGWAWCGRCEILFSSDGTLRCAAGGAHDPGDDAYVVMYDEE